jgi:hypothetical protein
MSALFDIKNIVDLNAFSNGLTKTINTKVGVIIPMVALDYAKNIVMGTINLGGNAQIITMTALGAFFDIWKTEIITSV